MQDINLNTNNTNNNESSQEYKKTNLDLNLDGDKIINQKLDKTKGNITQPRIISTAPNQNILQSKTGTNLRRTANLTRQFKKLEEELAELEAEFAAEEAKSKPLYQRLDFSNEGDEWSTMAKYNEKYMNNRCKMKNKR